MSMTADELLAGMDEEFGTAGEPCMVYLLRKPDGTLRWVRTQLTPLDLELARTDRKAFIERHVTPAIAALTVEKRE